MEYLDAAAAVFTLGLGLVLVVVGWRVLWPIVWDAVNAGHFEAWEAQFDG
jgi:hypothetical protein